MGTMPTITSKLMILRLGCYNFRSCGKYSEEQPYHIIDFTKMTNSLLVVADQNGAGKSTLYKHLLDYCLTGKNSVADDKVDALLNSINRKQGMSTFMEWHFAGTTYRSERGRGKTKQFDIFKQVDGEWILIPDLPAKDSERQTLLYSLTGLEEDTAEAVIESTMVLGVEKFKGFLSLKAQEKRDLFEPIFGCSIFSQWNETAKAERTKVILEQKQTGLEIADLDLKVALAEQAVQHAYQERNTLEITWEARKEVLKAEVSNHTAALKEALEVDTEGLELNDIHSKAHYTLCWKVEELNHSLVKDLGDLGEFVIDDKDKVLVSLDNQLADIDQNIGCARKDVMDKKSSLDGDITRVIDQTKEDITTEESEHKEAVDLLETAHKSAIETSKGLIEFTMNAVEASELDLTRTQEFCEKGCEYFNNKEIELNKVTEKEEQYTDKIQRMNEAKSFILNKVDIENEKVDGLVHMGECPACKQHISEEYVQELRSDIETNIVELQKEVDVLDERISAGSLKVEELKREDIILELREAEEVYDKNLNLVTLGEDVLTNHKKELQDLQTKEVSTIQQYENIKLNLISTHQQKVAKFQSILDTTESQVRSVMGGVEAKYKQLLEAKPIQVANILQQIEDRKEAMKGDHGGKERNLKEIHKLAVENTETQIEALDSQLVRDLQALVDNKDRDINLKEASVAASEGTLGLEKSTFESKLQTAELKASSADLHLHKLSGKLTGLNMLHDKQQKDIEDWDNVLLMISEKEGKGDVISYYLPELNKNINKYLNALGMFINVKVDNTFNITMEDDTRVGQSLNSLSVGQKSRVNLSIMLALRDVATSRNGMECNVMVLDEILGNFNEQGVVEVVGMLKEKFADLNLIVISQNKTLYAEYFDDVREYGLRSGFTTLLENE